jgi:hypothetical protein
MISWPHALGQNIIVERIWQRKKFTSWWIESRETDTGTGGQRPGITFKGMPPMSQASSPKVSTISQNSGDQAFNT